MLDNFFLLCYNIDTKRQGETNMYYQVYGYVGTERHSLGWTDSKHDARDWAYFCMFNCGYDWCEIITEDGEIIANYKKGK